MTHNRILVLSVDSWLDRLHGTSILTIFHALAKLGHKITVLLPSTDNRIVRKESITVIGLKVERLGLRSTFLSPFLWKRFMKFLFENRPSTLIFDLYMLPLFLLAKLLYKSEGILLVLSRPVGEKGLKEWLLFLHFRLSLIFAKLFVIKIFSVGTLGLGRLGNIPKHKIIEVPPPLGQFFLKSNSPIDKDQLRLKLGFEGLLGKKVLLYHGVLQEQRGILEVLEIFTNSSKGDDDIVLLLVGDGSATSSVKNYIRNNKTNKIIFQGVVPYSTMPEIIEASDIGLVLLPDNHQWPYQCPTKLIEFLAMGKPVIASDLPGIRWVAGNSPSVVYMKTLNVSVFKEAIKKALVKRDIKPSKEMTDRFSSYSMAQKLNQVVRARDNEKSSYNSASRALHMELNIF